MFDVHSSPGKGTPTTYAVSVNINVTANVTTINVRINSTTAPVKATTVPAAPSPGNRNNPLVKITSLTPITLNESLLSLATIYQYDCRGQKKSARIQ